MHYTYEDILGLNIKGYAKAGCRKKLLLVLKYLDPNNSDSYDNWTPFCKKVYSDDDTSHVPNCACSHKIKCSFIIQHKTTFDTVSVGCDCINKFKAGNAQITKRTIELHKNPGNKYCLRCDRKLPQKLVDEFPDVDNLYHKKCWKEHKHDLYNEEEVDCIWCDIKPKRKNLEAHNQLHKKENDLFKSLKCKITFGKYKGRRLYDIFNDDKHYLQWLSKKSYDETIKRMSYRILWNNIHKPKIMKHAINLI